MAYKLEIFRVSNNDVDHASVFKFEVPEGGKPFLILDPTAQSMEEMAVATVAGIIGNHSIFTPDGHVTHYLVAKSDIVGIGKKTADEAPTEAAQGEEGEVRTEVAKVSPSKKNSTGRGLVPLAKSYEKQYTTIPDAYIDELFKYIGTVQGIHKANATSRPKVAGSKPTERTNFLMLDVISAKVKK